MEHLTGLALVGLVAVSFVAVPLRAAEPGGPGARGEPILLWPGTAPGDKGDIGEEKDMTKHDPKTPAGQEVIRLGNVSKPTITLFRPAADKDTGAAVIVCPAVAPTFSRGTDYSFVPPGPPRCGPGSRPLRQGTGK